MKKIKQIFKILFIAILLLLFSNTARAASFSFSSEQSDIRKDDTFIIDVKVSTQGERINVAEGSLSFDKDHLQVLSITTGDSAFSLWTREPVFSNENGTIIFSGGVPNGIQGDNKTIFKIVFLATQTGVAKLSFLSDATFYLNDGQGTAIVPDRIQGIFNIVARGAAEAPTDAWQSILGMDKFPPENLEINLVRDPSMFDNKFYINFNATDNGSGMQSFEVKEGNGSYIQTESPYVLKDQSLRSAVLVRATDKAGNSKVVELQKPFYLNWIFWIIVLIIIAGIVMSYLKIRNAKK
jgi:hypothetical protein